MKNIPKWLRDIWTLAIVCDQWGDTGKGKFVDLLAEWADIIVRGTGGDNAGHTMCLGEKKYIFHLIPSGILRDAEGKINIIGNGVVFNPRVADSELKILDAAGLPYGNLKIARNTKLILPQHILLDRIKEDSSGKAKIGTTGRGIGPAYVDYYARTGLTVMDMLNPDIFRKKLRENLREKLRFLKTFRIAAIEKILSHEFLEYGIFFDKENILNEDVIISRYLEHGQRFREMIVDADAFVRENVGKKHILLEGAQGLYLSVDYGTYPFVTSSDSSRQGLVKGSGLRDCDLDLTLGIVKVPETRVGEGPFPTELGGARSETWCGSFGMNKERELAGFSDADINSTDEFEQGVAIRLNGDEYGATTKRPRRTGWLDLAMLRYAVQVNGPDVIFTKMDVLTGCKKIKLCDHYLYWGDPIDLGDRQLMRGDKIMVTIPNAEIMKWCVPQYVEFPGWEEYIGGIRRYRDLPKQVKTITDFILKSTGAKLRILSVGADRKETIFL